MPMHRPSSPSPSTTAPSLDPAGMGPLVGPACTGGTPADETGPRLTPTGGSVEITGGPELVSEGTTGCGPGTVIPGTGSERRATPVMGPVAETGRTARGGPSARSEAKSVV